MTDQTDNNLAKELREAEKFEARLTRLFSSLQPPLGAPQRLLARLKGDTFHESELTLDDAGPYSFAEHAALAGQDAAGSDLLAAGLEEEAIEDESDDD